MAGMLQSSDGWLVAYAWDSYECVPNRSCMLHMYSYKRVKGRSHTVEKRISMLLHIPHVHVASPFHSFRNTKELMDEAKAVQHTRPPPPAAPA